MCSPSMEGATSHSARFLPALRSLRPTVAKIVAAGSGSVNCRI